MPNIDKGVIVWGGAPIIGGGVSIFYASPFTGTMAALGNFFSSIANQLPSSVGITFPSSGDTIDSGDGHLIGTWTTTAPAPVVGTDAGDFPVACGAVVQWNTATISPGKPPTNKPFRVVGHTFIVPLGGTSYSTTGTIDAAALSSLQAAAAALIAGSSGGLRIWSRNTVGLSNGVAAPVISSRVRSKVAILRSRRD